jgi:hypothetical protein
MGRGWGRTVRHRSGPTDTGWHASCPLTSTNSLGQHRLASSDTPGVGLLICGLGVQVPRGAPHLTWPFVRMGEGPESISSPDGTEMGPGNSASNLELHRSPPCPDLRPDTSRLAAQSKPSGIPRTIWRHWVNVRRKSPAWLNPPRANMTMGCVGQPSMQVTLEAVYLRMRGQYSG